MPHDSSWFVIFLHILSKVKFLNSFSPNNSFQPPARAVYYQHRATPGEWKHFFAYIYKHILETTLMERMEFKESTRKHIADLNVICKQRVVSLWHLKIPHMRRIIMDRKRIVTKIWSARSAREACNLVWVSDQHSTQTSQGKGLRCRWILACQRTISTNNTLSAKHAQTNFADQPLQEDRSAQEPSIYPSEKADNKDKHVRWKWEVNC